MKKIISSLLALSVICSMTSQVFAEASANSMEKVLASVEKRITLPTNYDAFLSNSYTDENGIEYTFSWETGDSEKRTAVTVNENGIISSYQYIENDTPESQKPSVAKVPENALYNIACDYVKQLNPNIYENLRITPDKNTENPVDASYCFDIQRYENNIPVDGNCGYISVTADGKTLKDFFLTYTTGVDFEKADKLISRSAAQKAYADKIGFSLYYGSIFTDNGIAAVPIYTVNNSSMNCISAVSGNQIKLNDVSYVYETSSEEATAADSCPELQDEYTSSNELNGMNGILSEKQAETLVRRNNIVNIPTDYTLKSIIGAKACYNTDKGYYTLLFTDKNKRSSVEVMLDAKSGQIVNFSRNQNKGNKTITNEQAMEIAENAVLCLAPNHVNDYILSESTQNGIFTFIRNVNGIEFSSNQISICVDMTSGDITWYDYSYDDIEFPSLENVIPKDKITKIFFENSDFSPMYVLNCSKQGMTSYDKATLVYKFSNSDINEFNAFTGKPMWGDEN